MANNVNVPKLQTDDRVINQLQQNMITGMNAMNSVLVKTVIVGEIKTANLTESQFQAQAGIEWVTADGRNVIGSAYAKLTGNNVVPNIGATSFIRIN